MRGYDLYDGSYHALNPDLSTPISGDHHEKGVQRSPVHFLEWTQDEHARVGWHRPGFVRNSLRVAGQG
jgi:hypothetical protein